MIVFQNIHLIFIPESIMMILKFDLGYLQCV